MPLRVPKRRKHAVADPLSVIPGILSLDTAPWPVTNPHGLHFYLRRVRLFAISVDPDPPVEAASRGDVPSDAAGIKDYSFLRSSLTPALMRPRAIIPDAAPTGW